MTSEGLSNAIQGRFATQVATPRSLATIYDNDPTKPPADGSLYCRLTIRDGDKRRVTVGVLEYRTIGIAIAQLFGPVGDGTKTLRQHADAIVTAFQDVTADGVKYGVPTVNNIGDPNGSGKYQINVVCPFQAATIG